MPSLIPDFPNGAEYEKLYARYFAKGTDYMIDYIYGCQSVLDLCGGTGRLTKALVESGFETTYHDGNEQMCLLDNSYNKIFCSVKELLDKDLFFDGIICMQAVNYWFNHVDLKKLSKMTNKLVFNTFANRPHDSSSKEYSIDGVDFTEAYVLEDGIVKHFQSANTIVEGVPDLESEHYSEFEYISLSCFLSKLLEVFKKVRCETSGNSAIFICENN